jgi:hypothetical protein
VVLCRVVKERERERGAGIESLSMQSVLRISGWYNKHSGLLLDSRNENILKSPSSSKEFFYSWNETPQPRRSCMSFALTQYAGGITTANVLLLEFVVTHHHHHHHYHHYDYSGLLLLVVLSFAGDDDKKTGLNSLCSIGLVTTAVNPQIFLPGPTG